MKKIFVYIFNLSVVVLFLSISVSQMVKAATLTPKEYEQLSEIFQNGKIEELREKIASGLNVNASYQCHRPLPMAVRTMAFAYGSIGMATTPQNVMEMIKMLVEAGADVNEAKSPQCKIDKSPMAEAVALPSTLRGLNYIFTKTIEDQINPIIDECRKTGSQDAECTEMTGEKRDLMVAEVNKFYDAKQKELEPDTLQILKYLLMAGADINQKNSRGQTVLHAAIIHYRNEDSLNIIKFLIENGADINASDANGYTPLFFTYDKPKARQYLIQAGANKMHRDKRGNFYNEMMGRSIHEYVDDEGYHKEIAKY